MLPNETRTAISAGFFVFFFVLSCGLTIEKTDTGSSDQIHHSMDDDDDDNSAPVEEYYYWWEEVEV
jgi:hypothetical protein